MIRETLTECEYHPNTLIPKQQVRTHNYEVRNVLTDEVLATLSNKQKADSVAHSINVYGVDPGLHTYVRPVKNPLA